MNETAEQVQARIRQRQLQLQAEAHEAAKHIGRMLNMPGMLDPQERDLLETAQAVVARFET